MENSDFIIYLDESGDHSLTSIDQTYPIFVLTLCAFRKSDYVDRIVPAMQRLKFKWFGHDLVVFHENDIVRRRKSFGFLQFDDKRNEFMADIDNMLDQAPMTLFTAVIRKVELNRRYRFPEHPYNLALLFCLEKAYEFLRNHGEHGKRVHLICEARSPREKGAFGREDMELELHFRRIVQGRHPLQGPNGAMPCFEIIFASKHTNSTGLQLADLLARPIGLNILRPQQRNRAFERIAPKIWRGPKGSPWVGPLYGLKVFP